MPRSGIGRFASIPGLGFCQKTFHDIVGNASKVDGGSPKQLLSMFRNKMPNPRAVFCVALHFLFGALILLCVQARLSKAVPLEGPLKDLSSATRMIHDRSARSDQMERQAGEPDAHHVSIDPDSEFVRALLQWSPTRPVLRRHYVRAAYYLRPPPHRW